MAHLKNENIEKRTQKMRNDLKLLIVYDKDIGIDRYEMRIFRLIIENREGTMNIAVHFSE